jgi:hypothetical protein
MPLYDGINYDEGYYGDDPPIKDLSNQDKLKLRQPQGIDHQIETVDQETYVPSPAQETETAEDRLQNLLSDLSKQEQYSEAIIENIKPYAIDLTFAVPESAIEIRAALIALDMNPEKINFQDYVELLRLQLDIAQQMAQEHTNL